MKTTLLNILLAATVAFGFNGCKKDTPTNNSYPMQFRMTDAAGPYDAVYIDVQSVEVNAGGSWVTLNTHAGVYDMTKLTNGVDTFLASGSLTSGTVSQVRLVLGTNNTVVVNGTSYPLKTPSAQQSGLKLQVNYTLLAGVTYVVWIDFDANRSIVKQGNGDYSLKPVIRTTTTATSGAIKGQVIPASTNPAIYAIKGTDSIGAFTDVYGNFMFSGMSAGTYNIAFVPAPPLAIKVVSNVDVTIGTVTNIGTITLP